MISRFLAWSTGKGRGHRRRNNFCGWSDDEFNFL